jgi:hypothetical protein
VSPAKALASTPWLIGTVEITFSFTVHHHHQLIAAAQNNRWCAESKAIPEASSPGAMGQVVTTWCFWCQ